MGRGDRKSRQGKIRAGSYGKRRPKPDRRSKTMKNARPSTKSGTKSGAKSAPRAGAAGAAAS